MKINEFIVEVLFNIIIFILEIYEKNIYNN